jgi:hypothetical protein
MALALPWPRQRHRNGIADQLHRNSIASQRHWHGPTVVV